MAAPREHPNMARVELPPRGHTENKGGKVIFSFKMITELSLPPGADLISGPKTTVKQHRSQRWSSPAKRFAFAWLRDKPRGYPPAFSILKPCPIHPVGFHH